MAVEGLTYVDDVLLVADEQVAEDAGFVQVPQADHVLHAVDGGGVHGLEVGGVLRREPVLLRRGGVGVGEMCVCVCKKFK